MPDTEPKTVLDKVVDVVGVGVVQAVALLLTVAHTDSVDAPLPDARTDTVPDADTDTVVVSEAVEQTVDESETLAQLVTLGLTVALVSTVVLDERQAWGVSVRPPELELEKEVVALPDTDPVELDEVVPRTLADDEADAAAESVLAILGDDVAVPRDDALRDDEPQPDTEALADRPTPLGVGCVDTDTPVDALVEPVAGPVKETAVVGVAGGVGEDRGVAVPV